MSQSRALAAAKSNNEREVTKSVRRRLREYYRKNGIFPNYAQLNILLPPGAEVLQNYEIVYFKVVPNDYRRVLRNLNHFENLEKNHIGKFQTADSLDKAYLTDILFCSFTQSLTCGVSSSSNH